MQDNKFEQNIEIFDPTRYSITVSIDPIEKLKAITEQELIKLNNEKRQMQSVHSNLDLLLKRYDLEKSYFGQISNWYGSKPWWVKILLFILSAGIAAGIGLLCHMPITIVLITTGLHIFFAFFFINHYTIHQKQTKRLCEDIIELEKSLTVTINHFNALSKSLNKILINLHELNSQILSDSQVLKENVNLLKQQVAKYKSITIELEQSKQSIIKTTSQVQQNLIDGDKHYLESCALVEDKASQIESICTGLELSQKAFQLNSKSLERLVDQQKKISGRMDTLLTYIENRAIPHIEEERILHETEECIGEEPSAAFEDETSQKILEESKKARLRTHEVLQKLKDNCYDTTYLGKNLN